MMRRRSRDPFGQVAVNLGFCTPQDVKKALAVQKELAAAGEPHKLVGMILLERGVISTTQLIQVLKYCDRSAGAETATSQSISNAEGHRACSPGRTRKGTGNAQPQP